MTRLRFAVLCDSSALELWHVQCLRHLDDCATLAAVISAPRPPQPAHRSRASLLMRVYAWRAANRTRTDASELLRDVPRLSVADLRTATDRLDFVLRLGRVQIPADVESATRCGVWHFEHETSDEVLPFFREVYDRQDVTHAALLALDPKSRELVLLEEAYFRTERRAYPSSRDHVLDNVARWPARVCRRLCADARGDSHVRRVRTKPPPEAPKRLRLLPFGATIARRHLDVARQRLFRHPQWNIGIVHLGGHAIVEAGLRENDISWFPLGHKDGFFADPFGVVRDGTVHIVCEYFDYRLGKGEIWAIDYTAQGFSDRARQVLSLPVHMSYPALVEVEDQIYCVPETCAVNEVALYRAIDFPERWMKVAVLVPDFPGVDPTVFRHDGRWWLLCTRSGPYEDAELWVWHATELFGPWTPHLRNPVKTDVRCTRPGGPPFLHDGVLCRPTQDCSQAYGRCLSVQRITRLTPTEFAEEPVTVLAPSPTSRFPDGRHTLTVLGDMVIVDGRRDAFVWPAFQAFLRIWTADVVGKVRRRFSWKVEG